MHQAKPAPIRANQPRTLIVIDIDEPLSNPGLVLAEHTLPSVCSSKKQLHNKLSPQDLHHETH